MNDSALQLVPAPEPDDRGRADQLRSMLRDDFLSAIEWDDIEQAYKPARDHPQLGLRKCAVLDCNAGVRTPNTELCKVCIIRFNAEDIALGDFIKRPCGKQQFGQKMCIAMDCDRAASFACSLCRTHFARWQRSGTAIEDFVRRPSPLGGKTPECKAHSCSRVASSLRADLCENHRQVWNRIRAQGRADYEKWLRTVDPITADYFVIFKGLNEVVQAELLVAAQARMDTGARVLVTELRCLVSALRHAEATTLDALNEQQISDLRSDARSFHRQLLRVLEDRLCTPESERHKAIWNLKAFGISGTMNFTGIRQAWLLEAAKNWVENDLPMHRGDQRANSAKRVIAAVTGLSEQLLRSREDNGENPRALNRTDIVGHMNRLAYMERSEEMTANTRIGRCRDLKRFLHDIRVLGLTKDGGPADGLPDDFHLGRRDVPSAPIQEEAGKGLPDWVIRIICANLHRVEERSSTTYRRMIELLIDTGRRPDEICRLPLNCLERDAQDMPVLVYKDSKNNKPGQRLPIPNATAKLIAEQQADVREQFSDRDPKTLVLFPRDRFNQYGTKQVTEPVFGKMHRDFITEIADQLVQQIQDPDGTTHEERFDPYAIIPYAYRHTYAQRHADEGVAPDVLRDLMGHETMQTTIGYYQVTAKRVRAAVDRVSEHQFDGQGRRVFSRIEGMLSDAHARMRIGQVAVPFGTCTEPANVKAAGQACPYKFTCLGCGHFRSDPSYLPELKSYLQQLLAERAQVNAATELQDWAKAKLAPRDEEIDQLRSLIRRIEADLNQVTESDRALIEEAITVVRTTRTTVSLGFPTIAPPLEEAHRER